MTELTFSVEEGIATVTLNRPEKRNALTAAMLEELTRITEECANRADVRVVIVRGEGKAFCSGLDLTEMGRVRGGEPLVEETFRAVERCCHPTIAMVNGDALAGGCELALHCDLRIAAEGARLGMPLARLGLVVPFPLLQKLLDTIGTAATKELLFTGEPIDAGRAKELGMVNRVVPLADLQPTAYRIARTVADNAPLSLKTMKACILRANQFREAIGHQDLDEMAARVRGSADAREGILAMLEKRKPHFRGE